MNGVVISEAISSGDWFEVVSVAPARGLAPASEEVRVRLRVLGFGRTSVEEIDEESDVAIEGALWLMTVEVVNVSKSPMESYLFRRLIAVADEEGFTFPSPKLGDLDLDEPSGLHRFAPWSSSPDLMPKIAAHGTIPFLLPESEAQYRLVLPGEGTNSRI